MMREVVIVPTTHMDIDYIAPPEESLKKYDRFIIEAINLIEKNERLRYSIEHCLAVKHFLENHPEYKERLKKLINDGKIEVMANWATPHYADLSGEHIVRQVAYSQYWLKKNFDIISITGNNGELCDSTLQLGQILNKCGIKFYHSAKIHSFPMKCRIIGENTLLIGLDGSTVLFNNNSYNLSGAAALYNYPAGKGNLFNAFEVPSTVTHMTPYLPGSTIIMYEVLDRCMQGDQALWSDGGRGGDDQFPDLTALDNFVRGWNKSEAEKYNVVFRLGTFKDFYKSVSQDINEGSLSFPRVIGHTEHGELLYYAWGWTKYRDRAYVEHKLLSAEKLSSILYCLGYSTYPEEQINKAWENIMTASTHNWGFKDSDKLFPQMTAEARKITDRLIKDKMKLLTNSIKYTKKGLAVLVFNPLNWERTDVVKVKLEDLKMKNVSVIDKDGEKTLSQITSTKKNELAFIAESVPSVGYKTYYVIEDSGIEETSTTVKIKKHSIENEYYMISMNNTEGITSIFDKKNQRELFKSPLGNIHTTAVEGLGIDRMYAKKENINPAVMKALKSLESGMTVNDVRITQTGPAIASVNVIGKALGSTITVTACLIKGINRIDLTISATPLSFEEILNNLKTTLNPTDYHIIRRGGLREGIVFYIPLIFNFSDKAVTRASVPYGSFTIDQPMNWNTKTTGDTFSQRAADADGWVGYFNEPYHIPLESLVSAKIAKAGWADIYDDDSYGITYAMEDGFNQLIRDKYNYNVFYKSLFQNSSSGHTYRFSFRAHEGSWQEAGSARFGEEISHPLIAESFYSNEVSVEKAKLPEEKSFIRIDPENVIMTTLKRSFNGGGVTARFYETHDTDTDVTVKIDLINPLENQVVSRTDMIDTDISGLIIPDNGDYIIPIKGSGIETIKINWKISPD